MKVERQKIKDEKTKQEKELGTLISEFSEKKDIELRAQLEKEEIEKYLREIQRGKLSALENDK